MSYCALASETGRYEGLDEEERICKICIVENEMHVFLDCTLYDNIRQDLFVKHAAKYEGFSIVVKLIS